MFQDLDATLAALLADPSAPSELRAAETSFLTPVKDYNPTPATLNFFLHGVRENRELHSSLPILDTVDNRYVQSVPPMRVDCIYLVTAWSPKAGDLKVAEEHQLLGAAVVWLSRNPVLPTTALVGSLRDPPQPYPVSSRLVPTKADEDLATFWTALGIAPRPMFSLTVTIAMQPYAEVEDLAAVETVDVDGVSMRYPALTGRVLDAAMAPVPGAEVFVVEKDQHVTSDRRGRFDFGELPFGSYTLLVRVPDRADVQQTVDFQAAAQVHNVHLPAS